VGQEYQSIDLPLRREAFQRPENCQPMRTYFWEIAKAIRDADVGIILAAFCDASDLQLTSETLLFAIHHSSTSSLC
jgi:hypothetical protein